MTCAMTLPREQGVPLGVSKIRSEYLAQNPFAASVFLRQEPDEEDEEEEEENDGEENEDDNEDDDEGYSP